MQISLGLAPGPRRRGRPPGAPALVRPPRLTGTGRIGAPLTLDPGVWTGALRLDFAWLRDGAPIAGATGPAYAPRPADDRAALACRVTAVGPSGHAAAETPAVAVAFPPPIPVGALPDLVFAQGTGIKTMDASPFFSGAALRFSITGAGASVDPATGLVTISVDALRAGEAILVVAENSGGRAELGFTLKVTPAAVAPELIAPPSIVGAARVGAELTLDPGAWAGEPAPELALQWLCDGAPIAGATGPGFVPGAAEDGAEVTAEVTARNAAGALAAQAEPVRVVRAAPAATGALADVVLAQGAPAARLEAAGAFAGEALVFAVAGAEAGIDPATGVVTLPTATRRAAETVTVTATNSGGSASVAFAAAVLAAPAATGTPEAAVFAVGAEAGTVPAAGFFAGDALGFALEAGPAGVTIDAATGVATVPTGAALEGAIVVRASNAVGAATQEFPVAVRAPAPPALVLTAPVVDIAAALGDVVTVDVGARVAPKAGLTWTSNRPNWPLSAAGVLTVPTTAPLTNAVAHVTATDAFGQSVTASFRVTVAAAAPAAPRLTGALADVAATVGDAALVDFGAIVEGTGLVFTVDRPWAIDARGVLSVPTAAPLDGLAVTLTATDALGRAVSATVRVTVTPPALVLTEPVADVAAALGDVVTVDVGARVAPKAGLTWTSNRPNWPLSAAGVLTVPTTAPLTNAIANVTATDAFGQSVTASFRVTVAAAAVPPMTLTAAPTFAPAAAPGTAVGSVWNIAGGGFAGGLAPFVTERRFLRDGAAIGAFGAATAYAIVAADRGKTITAQVRRSDSSVPPQVLTVDATGAAIIPAAPIGVPNPDFVVGTTAQLLNAMITAAGQAGPKVIACQPGNYAALTRNNALVKVGKAANGTNLNNRVTVISADRNNPATWRDTSWSLQNLDGFTFDGLRFLGTTDDGQGFAILGRQAINCQNLSNVTFRNCAWDGWCDNLAVTRSVNLTIEWNDMKGAGRDSVRLFDRHQNLLVQHNDFDGFRGDGSPGVDYTRSQMDEPNRHADFLSIQISTVAARGGINMRILNNKFRSGNGYHQGFFCANSMLQGGGTDFNTYKTTGLVCTGNWFEMCHVNCLYISGCEDFVCQNNMIRRIPAPAGGFWNDTALGQPTLVLAALSTGVVADVVSHRAIKLDNRMPNLAGVAVRNYVVDARGAAKLADLPAPPRVGAYGYE